MHSTTNYNNEKCLRDPTAICQGGGGGGGPFVRGGGQGPAQNPGGGGGGGGSTSPIPRTVLVLDLIPY